MSIALQNRNESYYAILKTVGERHKQCLVGLEELGGQATANQLARHLLSKGIIPFYNTNYTNPRLIELRELGVLEVTGKRKDEYTGKSVAIYSIKEDFR